ncbi:MAG: ABC transporter ATP-binding protein [Alphaproteobacteria bacterium]
MTQDTAAQHVPTPAPTIVVEKVGKRFAERVIAVDDVDLVIAQNEFFALLGPSGCGKTTLLRMLAGFEAPTSGRIMIDGRDMARIAPNRRPVNMVFQSYAVFPHMTVAANVGYGLRVTGVAAAERERRVKRVLEMVRLTGLEDRKPDKLSGGQRQRVALARALVKEPKVLLLDEPLSALDKKLREEMQFELKRLQREVGITFVIVTHDQDEAMSMADRIGVMNAGRIAQIGTPEEIYERPASRFVADFIGSVNLFEGEITARNDSQILIRSDSIESSIEADSACPGADRVAVGDKVWAAIRPERLALVNGDVRHDINFLTARLSATAYQGESSLCQLTLRNGQNIKLHAANSGDQLQSKQLAPGSEIGVTWTPQSVIVLTE